MEKQHCASISCVDDDGNPYCFSCFYAFNAEEGLLYFKSSPVSYHIKLMMQKPGIAGSILPDKLQVLAVKGVQFQGIVLSPGHELVKGASRIYHRKFPFAYAIPGEVWAIQIIRIKMTDSTKSFGKKLQWERSKVVDN
jgi:Uncharacterized protein conserved in bacteria